jgi:hypothetical protein
MDQPLPYKVIESEDGLTLKVSNHSPEINPSSLLTSHTEKPLAESVDSDPIKVTVTLLDKVAIICSFSGELGEASYEDMELTLELLNVSSKELEKFLAVQSPVSNSLIVEFGTNIMYSQKSISLKRFKLLKRGVEGWTCEVVVSKC